MRTAKDVEAYLAQSNRRYRALDGTPGTFVVESSMHAPPIAVRVDPPLVVLRVQLAHAPTDDVQVYKRLLAANAKTQVHTSFGLEGNVVVLSSALELENLDFNEIEATLDEMDLTLGQADALFGATPPPSPAAKTEAKR
jgi:hypothetical protein